MWVGLLSNRINNKLEKSNLIDEHALIRGPAKSDQHQFSPNNNRYKKISAQGKTKWKKIHARQYSFYGLKKSYKEFDNDKKLLRLENSPPPITFLMVRP